MRTKFIISLCLFSIIQSNLLTSSFFNQPIMPNDLVYYNFAAQQFPETNWIFESETTYVTFNYPQPKTEFEAQLLFIDANEFRIKQYFNIPSNALGLKIVAYYRMPFSHTTGRIHFSVGDLSLFTISFEPQTHNRLNRIEGIARRIPLQNYLLIKSTTFEDTHPLAPRRFGYQVMSVVIYPLLEYQLLIFLEKDHEKKKEKKLKQMEKYGINPIGGWNTKRFKKKKK